MSFSRLLNIPDGLRSCYGEECIIVFTMNHMDGIDLALLHPGRMDAHELVERYVGVGEHKMLDAAEAYKRDGVTEMTTTEVGEVLLRNKDEPYSTVMELATELKVGVSTVDDLHWEDSAKELSNGSSTKKGRKELSG